MGQVLLVRHGQASWGAEDYDVLSPLGERQAAVVGEALAGVRPDRVLSGSMVRQRETARIAVDAAGWSVPTEVDERWNEMDHLAVLAAQPAEHAGRPDRRQFQAWFEQATDRWLSGDHDGDYAESWAGFVDRVMAALAELAGSGTAVVFTSGGPVAAAAGRLLEGGRPAYRRIAPVVVNASVTRVVSGGRGLSLVSLNEQAHVAGDLLSYR